MVLFNSIGYVEILFYQRNELNVIFISKVLWNWIQIKSCFDCKFKPYPNIESKYKKKLELVHWTQMVSNVSTLISIWIYRMDAWNLWVSYMFYTWTILSDWDFCFSNSYIITFGLQNENNNMRKKEWNNITRP